MLSSTHSFRKLNILSKKRPKFDLSNKNISLEDLALLVKRLSVQIDDLGSWKDDTHHVKLDSNITLNQQQTYEPPMPLPQPQTNHEFQSYQDIKVVTAPKTKIPLHITIDPWATHVPQCYSALLQKIEDVESFQKCPNECCSSTITVSSADGVPWPRPIEPFQSNNTTGYQYNLLDILETQYAHWCTLMRCIPIMDPITSAHVKTVGLYAMREILKAKAMHKREHDYYNHHYYHKHHSAIVPKMTSCCVSVDNAGTNSSITSSTLKGSLSCLASPERSITRKPVATTAPVYVIANEDMPSWMCLSETKTALSDLAEDIPPPVPPKESEINVTPTPSGRSSPLFSHTGRRFQRWIMYKKAQRKANTNTANTPMEHSQSFKKNRSLFF
ncbi:MAG: hypothetical protein EXX96DRAFT_577665 [Benjaminiella poitrasii]|nr:MAG: hypothetical protein EXX96DRAFT_577665 [Benjaminiella poitrasii]